MKQKILNHFPYLGEILLILPLISLIILGVFFLNKKQPQEISQDSNQLKSIEQTYNTSELENYYEFTALEKTDLGIQPNTDFELKANTESSVEEIQSSLAFTPNISFVVAQTDSQTYKISPTDSLPSNSILTATIQARNNDTNQERTLSWAYQVEGEFQILSTFPRNQATNVPLNSGIEVNFSHLNVENFENQFSISPTVEGKFEYHQKTISFIPDDPLLPETIYSIQVGKEVRISNHSLPEDYSFQFETERSKDSAKEKKIYGFGRATYETAEVEPPVFTITGRNLNEVGELKLNIYQLKDIQQFKDIYSEYAQIPWWSSYGQKKWFSSTDKLTFFSTFSTSLVEVDSMSYALTAPEPLPTGLYLVQVEGEQIQSLLQVSNISAFIETSKTDLLIWANDDSTQKPISGLTVTLPDSTEAGTTNGQGILQINMPTEFKDQEYRKNNFILLSKNSDFLLLPLQTKNSWDYTREINGEEFWSYLYLDQPFYKPTDTVNFWGMAQPRYGSTLSEVTVELSSYRLSDEPLQTQTLPLSTYGSFEGNFSLDNLQTGDYYIVIKIGEVELFSKYLTVLTFNKPSFDLEVTPKTTAVYSGETVTHQIKATFFDGTPLAGLELSVDDTTVITNAEGTAEYTKTYESEKSEYYPSYDSLYIHPTYSEEAEVTTSAEILVYPSLYTIEFENSDVSENKGTVSGTIFTTDLSKYEEENSWERPSVQDQAVPGKKIKAIITREWYTKEQTGTKYNFLQKQSYPIYKYSKNTETVSEQALTTNSDGTFDLTFDLQQESNYLVKIEATDPNGKSVSATKYVNPYVIEYFGRNFYSVEISNVERGQYSVGESVPIEFLENAQPLPENSPGTFLFTFSQQGIRSVVPSRSPRLSFTFTEEYIPNVVIQGIWYDGRSYWYSDTGFGFFRSTQIASFEEKDKEMKVQVSTDKESYEPGDTVEMDILATKSDGSSDKTVLNINLIDEAVYHILPNWGFGYQNNYRAGFNSVLYRDISSGILSAYASHYYPKDSNGVEGGGGGDARTDFPDKAFFKTITTDNSGKAHVSFTLPDNITSWRMNVHALSSDLYAGSSFSNLPVTKPFFVNAVINSSYLSTDSPIIKVRSFGSGLNSETPVSITVSSPTLGFEEKLNSQGSNPVEVQLNNLSVGKHEIKFTVESNGQTDEVVRNILVVDTNQRWKKIYSEDVASGWKLSERSDEPVSLTITDKQKGQYYPYLTSSLYQFGDRLDQKVGRMLAAEMLKQHFNEEISSNPLIPTEYQHTENGGLMIFPYGDSDDMLSAQVAGTSAVELFDKKRLASYFSDIFADTTLPLSNKVTALYGLANLKEPVLVDIYTLLSASETTAYDRLILSLALAELGDYQKSAEVFHEIESENKVEIHSDQWAIKLNSSESDWVRDSFIAANITALLQESQADKYFNYAYQNQSKAPDVSSDLLIARFLQTRLRNLPTEPTQVQYLYNGEEKTVTFETDPKLTLALSSDAQDTFEILKVEGKAAVTIQSSVKPEEQVANSDSVSVSRSYQGDMKDGSIVKVTLLYHVPDQSGNRLFQITDFLPSGLQPIMQPKVFSGFSETRSISAYNVTGQKVSFCVWYLSKKRTVTYYARVIKKGQFLAEAPIIQSVKYPDMRSFGNEETITIQ